MIGVDVAPFLRVTLACSRAGTMMNWAGNVSHVHVHDLVAGHRDYVDLDHDCDCGILPVQTKRVHAVRLADRDTLLVAA